MKKTEWLPVKHLPPFIPKDLLHTWYGPGQSAAVEKRDIKDYIINSFGNSPSDVMPAKKRSSGEGSKTIYFIVLKVQAQIKG